MANLSKTSNLTRKILEIAAAGIVGFILVVIIIRVGFVIKDIFAPTPAAKPTVAFGKLSNVSLPQNIGQTNYSYTINTLTGSLPALPDRVNVYKMQSLNPSLLGLDKAKVIASAAQFLSDPTALSETQYVWNRTDPFPATFTINIQSFDFFMTGDYKDDPTVKGAAFLPSQDAAQQTAQQYFDTVMPLSKSTDDSKTKVSLFAINGSSLAPASSLSTAQIVRVDYFPKNIDTYPIYTANPTQSLTYALLASTETDVPQIVEAQYYHKDVSDTKATYPIKSVKDAYNELKQGGGFIAANPTGNSSVAITNVSLGYYIDSLSQDYLWPIIVFQGDKGFYAYVSALPDSWISK